MRCIAFPGRRAAFCGAPRTARSAGCTAGSLLSCSARHSAHEVVRSSAGLCPGCAPPRVPEPQGRRALPQRSAHCSASRLHSWVPLSWSARRCALTESGARRRAAPWPRVAQGLRVGRPPRPSMALPPLRGLRPGGARQPRRWRLRRMRRRRGRPARASCSSARTPRAWATCLHLRDLRRRCVAQPAAYQKLTSCMGCGCCFEGGWRDGVLAKGAATQPDILYAHLQVSHILLQLDGAELA